MKKILFIIPSLTQTNGVAAFMVNYLKNFEFKEFNVEVIYNDLRTSSKYIDFFEKMGIKLYKMPYVREVGIKKYCVEIREFFKEHHDYNLIYSNVSYQSYFFFKEAQKYGLSNFLIHAHATQASDNMIKNVLGNFIQKKVNKMVKYKYACSKLAGEAMFNNDKFIIINNAIDYNKYAFNSDLRDEIRKKHGIKNDEKIIGFVGRFAVQKNVYFFIDLIKKLPNEYKIIMIGNGEQKKEFVNLIKKDKLEERFILIDEISNVNEYYSVFDYFALPSLYEGLPIVGVEAQANGLPCLLSNTISSECTISNNILYLSIDDVDIWTKKIKEVKRNNNPELKDEFDISIQARRLENLLEEIVK